MSYKAAKQQLKNAADLVKSNYPTDKTMCRQWINDTADAIQKDIINDPSWNISEAKREQYREWLSIYACKLHPKYK